MIGWRFINDFSFSFLNLQWTGFDTASLQKSCCGVGGDYDFSMINCYCCEHWFVIDVTLLVGY
jgi:hypothetical protein